MGHTSKYGIVSTKLMIIATMHCVAAVAYLDNFAVTVSPPLGENLSKCGGEPWRRTVENVRSC